MWNPLSIARTNIAPVPSRFLSGAAKSIAIGIALGLPTDRGQSGERFTTSRLQQSGTDAPQTSEHDMVLAANREELTTRFCLDLSFGHGGDSEPTT